MRCEVFGVRGFKHLGDDLLDVRHLLLARLRLVERRVRGVACKRAQTARASPRAHSNARSLPPVHDAKSQVRQLKSQVRQLT